MRLERTTSCSGGQEDNNLRDCKTKTYNIDENHFAACLAKILQKYLGLRELVKLFQRSVIVTIVRSSNEQLRGDSEENKRTV